MHFFFSFFRDLEFLEFSWKLKPWTGQSSRLATRSVRKIFFSRFLFIFLKFPVKKESRNLPITWPRFFAEMLRNSSALSQLNYKYSLALPWQSQAILGTALDADALFFGAGSPHSPPGPKRPAAVPYTHPRAHETGLDLVCRPLREKKNYPTLLALHNLSYPHDTFTCRLLYTSTIVRCSPV